MNVLSTLCSLTLNAMITPFDSPESKRRDNIFPSQLDNISLQPSLSISLSSTPFKQVLMSSGGYGGMSNIGNLRFYGARVCKILVEKGNPP